MTTEDIINFENNSGNELHLFRDRLFWQAWERSAFLFSRINSYEGMFKHLNGTRKIREFIADSKNHQ